MSYPLSLILLYQIKKKSLPFFSKVVKIIKTLSFLCLELTKKAKTPKTTFNYLIIIQYKISFKMRGHIAIFGDDQFLTY